MTKVLAGSSHHVLSFMRQNLTALLQISLLPIAIFALSFILQMVMMRGLMADLLALQGGATVDPAQLAPMFRAQGLMFAAGLPGMIAYAWFYVRIVRLYALGEMEWLGLTAATVKATLMTLVYGIGIYMLTMIVYLVLLIAVIIPVAIIAALAGSSAAAVGLIVAIAFAGIVAAMLILIWFSCRLFAGLPAVALGASPDFIKDMWRLTAGESWGLPLRLIASQLLMLILSAPFLGYLAWRFFSEVQNGVVASPDGALPPAFLLDLIDNTMPLWALFAVFYVPWFWFTALLFAEVFSRFKQRPATR